MGLGASGEEPIEAIPDKRPAGTDALTGAGALEAPIGARGFEGAKTAGAKGSRKFAVGCTTGDGALSECRYSDSRASRIIGIGAEEIIAGGAAAAW
jgi:hypothetical protein